MVRNSGGKSQSQPIRHSRLTGVDLSHTGEVDRSVVVSVNLVDHVLKLRLGGVLAEGAHHSAELLGGDLAYFQITSV